MLPADAEAVVAEFKQAVTASCAIYGVSLTGICRLVDDMKRMPRLPENPDPDIAFSDGNPNLPTTTHAGRMRFSELTALAEEGGLAEQRLGHQLLVFVYAIWETTYRPRLAAALGIEPSSIEAPILGDLRLMRNDILHNHGIADRSARCTELRWFERGDEIVLHHVHVVELDYKLGSLTFAPVP